MMDWINVNSIATSLWPGLSQVFPITSAPPTSRRSDARWAKERCEGWLGILDAKLLGLSQISGRRHAAIADYFGLGILDRGELVGCGFKSFPQCESAGSTR